MALFRFEFRDIVGGGGLCRMCENRMTVGQGVANVDDDRAG